VLVELDLLVKRQGCFAEEGELQRFGTAHGVEDSLGGDALVNVEGDHVHVKRSVLGFARPLKLRVQVRVVGVGSSASLPHLVGGGNAGRRIVLPPGLVVAVIPYLFLASGSLSSGHVCSLLNGCGVIIRLFRPLQQA
jgi:hypothetical protein